jgi:hypothetical protein
MILVLFKNTEVNGGIPLISRNSCHGFMLSMRIDKILIINIGENIPIHNKECVIKFFDQVKGSNCSEWSVFVSIGNIKPKTTVAVNKRMDKLIKVTGAYGYFPESAMINWRRITSMIEYSPIGINGLGRTVV